MCSDSADSPTAVIELSAYVVKRATGSSPEEAEGGLGLTMAAWKVSDWIGVNAGEMITGTMIKAALGDIPIPGSPDDKS